MDSVITINAFGDNLIYLYQYDKEHAFAVDPGDDEERIVLTGDTLFVGGCGRCFECDAKTMWRSLRKLVALPGDTLVYPGHDYAIENYEFALLIEPDNEMVRQRLQQVKQAQKEGMQAVPSTILQEKLTNPFLHFCSDELKAALEISAAGTEYVFAELRRRKDFF
jgi:hydroxyacylglutathione hydrolase